MFDDVPVSQPVFSAPVSSVRRSSGGGWHLVLVDVDLSCYGRTC